MDVPKAGEDDPLTTIVYHTRSLTGWKRSRHSILVDIGEPIAIRLFPIPPGEDGGDHGHPGEETRFFEIEIDQTLENGRRAYSFQNIYPVHAKRRLDWHLLNLRIRRGGWTITGRIPAVQADGNPQWAYTDDFNILFLSTGGKHDLEGLIGLITVRLDTIARSLRSGSSILSPAENQRAYREAFGSLFGKGIDAAFQSTALYREYIPVNAGGNHGGGARTAGPGKDTSGAGDVPAGHDADLNVDIGRIEELNDLSWLQE